MTRTQIFLDSNIIISHMEKTAVFHSRSIELYHELLRSNHIGIINSFVLNEIHNYYLRNHNQKTTLWVIKQILQQKQYTYFQNDFNKDDIRKICDISNRYNLKTFDSYHAYFCKKMGIKKIATFDKEFDKVKFLKVINNV